MTALFGFALYNLFSPGPNVVLLTTSGARFLDLCRPLAENPLGGPFKMAGLHARDGCCARRDPGAGFPMM